MKTFELTPYGVDFLGCKQCPKLWNRFICRTRNGCIKPKKIEYYEYNREIIISVPIFEIEENYSMICPECSGEMWGTKERGFVCTLCGKEINPEELKEEDELMSL